MEAFVRRHENGHDSFIAFSDIVFDRNYIYVPLM